MRGLVARCYSSPCRYHYRACLRYRHRECTLRGATGLRSQYELSCPARPKLRLLRSCSRTAYAASFLELQMDIPTILIRCFASTGSCRVSDEMSHGEYPPRAEPRCYSPYRMDVTPHIERCTAEGLRGGEQFRSVRLRVRHLVK